MKKLVPEKTYLVKLEFYNTDRKMKSIIRCIFISIIMHPNFMHFRQKISFKSALEIFIPVNGHFRIALKGSRMEWGMFSVEIFLNDSNQYFRRKTTKNFEQIG